MRKQLHGVWVTELNSPDGASCVAADHGAHLLSWSPAQGGPGLYLSERSKYGGSNPIRGGVPIVFPQFGLRGPGVRHGFARVQTWHQDFVGVEQEQAVLRYRLRAADAVDSGWPHQCDLVYEIAFSGQELHMSLIVHNPSEFAWEFNAALHTYLHVSDLDRMEISGLHNNAYFDQTKGGTKETQEAAVLRLNGEIDRIYLGVQEPIVISDRERTITVGKQGFDDAVVWNPGQEKAQNIDDIVPHDYRSFVCVEAGAIEKSITLKAGEKWVGKQSVTIHNT